MDGGGLVCKAWSAESEGGGLVCKAWSAEPEGGGLVCKAWRRSPAAGTQERWRVLHAAADAFRSACGGDLPSLMLADATPEDIKRLEGFCNGVRHNLKKRTGAGANKRARVDDDDAAARVAAERRAFGAAAAELLRRMEDDGAVDLTPRRTGKGYVVTMEYFLNFYRVMEALAAVAPQPSDGGVSRSPGFPVFDSYQKFAKGAAAGEYGPEMGAMLKVKALPMISAQDYVNSKLRAWMHSNRAALEVVADESPAWLMPDRAALPFAKNIEARARPERRLTLPRLSLLRAHAQALAPQLKAHMQGPASGWTLPEWWDV